MGMKVLVVGEVCNDITYFCDVSRISPEAPVPVADIVWKSRTDGMAGNVDSNLNAFGIDTTFLHQRLTQHIDKTRYVDMKSGQHLLRADSTHPNITPLDVSTIENINHYDAIVISDYNKGFITYHNVIQLRTLFNGPILIDSKKTDLGCFEGCIVKINELEHSRAQSVPRSTIVTLGSKGAMYDGKVYPSDEVKMFDVCGAGDTFLAGLTYKILQGDSIGPCIEFANKCAGIAVQHQGTYTLTKKDIESL
jgi:D-beta-D-heptose 7-phosphate kinase/D-beta-D-heptose 1-phosphate adenosyltransferase